MTSGGSLEAPTDESPQRQLARLSAVVASLPEGLIVSDPRGNVLLMNPAALHLHGFQQPEEARRSLESFDSLFELHTLTGQGVPLADWPLSRVMRGEVVADHEVEVYRCSDGVRWIGCYNGAPVCDATGQLLGYSLTVRDVTRQRELERAAALERNRLQAVLDALPVGVFIADLAGRIVMHNPAGAQIWAGQQPFPTAVSLSDYGMYQAWSTKTGEPIEPHQWGLVRALTHGEVSLDEELEIACFDGTRRTVLNYALPYHDAEGRIAGAVAVNIDITDRQRAQAESQARRLEAVARLAGGVAHDFNKILQLIRSHAWLMMDTVAEDHPLREDVEGIMAAADSGSQLARQLLSLAGRDAGETGSHDPREALQRTERLLDSVCGERIAWTLEATDTLPPVVLPAESLERILLNLAINAADAMPDGGRLHISAKAVAGTGGLRLLVSDTGCGMDAQTRDSIFDPFFTTKGGDATGLGLATVLAMVHRAGGSIEVHSAPERGTTFVIDVPAAAPAT